MSEGGRRTECLKSQAIMYVSNAHSSMNHSCVCAHLSSQRTLPNVLRTSVSVPILFTGLFQRLDVIYCKQQ